MSPRIVSRRVPSAARQRGQAMFLLAVLLLFGVSAVIYTMVGTTSVSIANKQADDTARTLALVKDALIGWSASRTPPTGGADARPGELPCPDMNNDGFDDGSCVAGAIGRVPWKTLGIPEPKDSSGETLWYAIADLFRNFNMSAAPINSDTLGNLTVYVDSSATPLTSQAVAVIFAPGASLGAQDRSCTVGVNCTAAGQCTTSPASLTPKCNPTNYLESTGGGDNAQTSGPFIQAAASSAFNDRLLVVTNADLMPVVEQRVARELRTILQNYKAKTACACTNLGLTAGCYPWADLSDGYSDAPFYLWPEGRNRGRIPVWGAAPHDWGALLDPVVYPSCPPSTYVPTLPSWFVNNDWRRVVYYSAGRNFLGPGACSTCVDSELTVTGDVVPTKEVVILMPGPLLGVPPRAPVPLDSSTYWQYYFEDPANQHFANDVYAIPTSTAYTRDRIFTIP